jgi:phosphatidylserine decarboxylase
MKHHGKARKAAIKLIVFSLILVILFLAFALLAAFAGGFAVAMTPILLAAWAVFALFTLYFFRDPNPRVPEGPDTVLSPGHGRVDAVDTTVEPYFMGGECRRISILLSVINVHIQNAPVTGIVKYFKYSTGHFLNALRTESAAQNENVLLGFETTAPPGRKVGVRLLAGVIARRIVPFVAQGDEVQRGERIGLIQFGSRVDVYLPLDVEVKAKVGVKVVGGQTIIALFRLPA